jgi:hypothetical protein
MRVVTRLDYELDDMTKCRRVARMRLASAQTRERGADLSEEAGRLDNAADSRRMAAISRASAARFLAAADQGPQAAAEIMAEWHAERELERERATMSDEGAERLAALIQGALDGPCETLTLEEFARRL